MMKSNEPWLSEPLTNLLVGKVGPVPAREVAGV